MPAGEKCPECGQVHTRCAGHKKQARGGGPCTKFPVDGATVCHMHGAAKGTPARKKAGERLATQAAEAAVLKHGLPREVNPHDALLEELWRTAGYIDYLEGQVQASPNHAWWNDLAEQRIHFRRIAFDCVRAGIEQRRMTLAEHQAQLVASYTRAVLTALGIDPGSEKVRQVVRRELSVIAGGGGE